MSDTIAVDNRVMINWSNFDLTDDGLAMRQKAIAEKKVIDFAYAMIGQGKPESPDQVYSMKSLIMPAIRVPVRRSVARETTHYLDIFIDNKDVRDEIFCTEIGVFAKFDDAEEYKLYGYTYAIKGYEQIPPGSVFRRKYQIGANTHISRSLNITVSYDDSNIYVPYPVFDFTQPTEFIATVYHGLGVIPLGGLYEGINAYGAGGYGEIEYGGSELEGVPLKLMPTSRNTVKVFAPERYSGFSVVTPLTSHTFALSRQGESEKNLTLVLR